MLKRSRISKNILSSPLERFHNLDWLISINAGVDVLSYGIKYFTISFMFKIEQEGRKGVVTPCILNNKKF